MPVHHAQRVLLDLVSEPSALSPQPSALSPQPEPEPEPEPEPSPSPNPHPRNALLDSVTPVAAPYTTAVALNVFGEGFPLGFHPDLSKAECRFASSSGARTVCTPLATLLGLGLA